MMMNPFRLVLTLLQFGAILLSAALGLLGLLAKPKDDAGRLTRQGRYTALGILVSGIIGLTAHTVTTLLENQRQVEAERQSLILLREIDRAVTRTRIVALGFDLDLVPGHPDFARYISRLRGTDHMSYNGGSHLYGDLWPDEKREQLARVALDQLNFSVWLFRAGNESLCPPPKFDPDFEFRTRIFIDRLMLMHNWEPERWWLELRSYRIDEPLAVNASFGRRTTAAIRSLRDLEGACIVASVHGREVTGAKEGDSLDDAVARSILVTRVIFGLDDGEEIDIHDLRRVKAAQGYVLFSGTVPHIR